jgi:hypothetical protein
VSLPCSTSFRAQMDVISFVQEAIHMMLLVCRGLAFSDSMDVVPKVLV